MIFKLFLALALPAVNVAAQPNPASSSSSPNTVPPVEGRPVRHAGSNQPAEARIDAIASQFRTDPAKIDVVADNLTDFIWTPLDAKHSFVDPKLIAADKDLPAGQRQRDQDFGGVRQWAAKFPRDAATLYYSLQDGSLCQDGPCLKKMREAMERWTEKSQATFTIPADQAPGRRDLEVPVGPRPNNAAPPWTTAFLADAVKHSRRLLGANAAPRGIQIQSDDKIKNPGAVTRWNIPKKKKNP